MSSTRILSNHNVLVGRSPAKRSVQRAVTPKTEHRDKENDVRPSPSRKMKADITTSSRTTPYTISRRKNLKHSGKKRKESRRVFAKRVDSAVSCLDDVMQSMEQQLQALESKNRSSHSDENNALMQRVKEVESAKSGLEKEIASMKTKMTSLHEESSLQALLLTAQISEKMERISNLEEELEKTEQQLSNAAADQEYERYRAQLMRAVRSELRDVFAKKKNPSQDELTAMRADFEAMKQQCFFSTALAIKLSYSLAGRPSNVEIEDLFKKANAAGITSQGWAPWIQHEVELELRRRKVP